MKKQMKKLALGVVLAASFLGMSQANAASVNVDFTVNMQWGGQWGVGSFSGNDSDNDGFLEFNELTSFDLGNNIETAIVNLTNLVDIGDFDIANNTWIGNGVSWIDRPNNAFFTWNNRINSVNMQWASVQTNPQVAQTPIPGAVWLFGSALAGLFGTSKRKKMLVAAA